MIEILSPHHHRGRRGSIRLVVIHDMEAPEKLDTAEAVARYFQRPKTKASAHVNVDADSRVRVVRDMDTAWAAPGANNDGLQLEMAGYANQGPAGWADPYSQRMLKEQAAPQVREWCALYLIPMKHLTDAELRAGKKGIVGHAQVSRVYKKSTHTDPGSSFPWEQFLDMVNGAAKPAPPRPSGGNPHPVPGRLLRLADPNMRGDDVKWVQFELGAQRDGVYGPATNHLVVHFQRTHGLGPDGVVGPNTVAALKRA